MEGVIKLNNKIESFKSMMRSIYAYGELTKEDNYLKPYKKELGSIMFDSIYEQHSEYLNNYFKRVTNVYTDSEGCTYNELVQIKPTPDEIQLEMDLHNNDEVGVNNQWTYADAEYHLLLSDKYHKHNG